MSNFADLASTQKTLESTLLKMMAGFEGKLQAISPQTTTDIEQLSKEFHDFKSYTHQVLSLLRQQITYLVHTTDEIEMRHRRKYLLLGGVPESSDSLTTVVATICKDQLELSDVRPSDISSCHRLGTVIEGKCRPLVFRTANPALGTLIWKNKTKLKGTKFVISEFLTRRRQELFLEARKRLGMKNVWTLSGNIYTKDPAGGRCRIHNIDDLDAIIPISSVPSAAHSLHTSSKRPVTASQPTQRDNEASGALRTRRGMRDKH
ncbi:uncharacterized protein LOC131852941 [Achroia grisella]|uniref:uncharacterized protein LOC131852941 n=1 Tax=Achroia grisella TaxID=688607 RepID=UPI0027D2EB93|nr:uncharacterized protein LOC131852941 [Achroia grisella]